MDNIFFNSESFSGDNAHGTMPQGFWFDDVRIPSELGTGTEARVQSWDPAVFNNAGGADLDVAPPGDTGVFTKTGTFAGTAVTQTAGNNFKSYGPSCSYSNIGRSVEGALSVVGGKVARIPSKNKMTLTLPILSGFFGILMPADAIKYIPLSAFPNLEMEFVLSEYAFFSYFTEHARQSALADSVNPRSYVVDKFVINCNLLFF